MSEYQAYKNDMGCTPREHILLITASNIWQIANIHFIDPVIYNKSSYIELENVSHL